MDFHDMKRIPANGQIIFGLSMSRLCNGQSPECIHAAVRKLKQRFTSNTVDFIFLYGNGLYQNNSRISYIERQKLIGQMFNHKTRLEKLLSTDADNIPSANIFLTWDTCLTSVQYYFQKLTILKQLYESNTEFRACVDFDTFKINEQPEAARAFLFEELIIFESIIDEMQALPEGISEKGWRLVTYQGFSNTSPIYALQNNIFTRYKQPVRTNRYVGHWYDELNGKLIDYTQVHLPIILANGLHINTHEHTAANTHIYGIK